jgi:biopolymer transport protein ExbB
MPSEGSTLMEVFGVGGVVMYPLLLVSVVSLSLTIERALFWRRMLSRSEAQRWRKLVERVRKRDWEAAAKTAKKDSTVFGIFAQGLIERAKEGATEADGRELIESVRGPIERFSTVLSTIITAAPMLGILGTVLGIIQSFGLLGASVDAAAAADPTAVATGIAQALYTTAFGLAIALLTLFPYAVFRAFADRAFARLETFTAIAVGS